METLKDLKVKKIIYPNGEYHLAAPAVVLDEGSFYRIDGTHIFDKHKIKEVVVKDGRVEIEITDRTVVLEVC